MLSCSLWILPATSYGRTPLSWTRGIPKSIVRPLLVRIAWFTFGRVTISSALTFTAPTQVPLCGKCKSTWATIQLLIWRLARCRRPTGRFTFLIAPRDSWVNSWRLIRITPPNGRLTCQVRISIIFSLPLLLDLRGIVYFGSTGGFVYALNPTTGAMIWQYQTPNGGGIYTSPAISSDGTLYVTSTDGHLYAINASNGQLVWQYPEANSSALGSINSSPVIGSDGTIYFGSADGNVYAVTNGVSGTTLASSDCPMFRNNPAHTGMLNSSDTCPLGGPGVTCFSQISAGPLTDSSFTLRCFAKPLSIWGVYKSSDQVTWTQIGSVTMGANGSAQFVDTTVTGVSTRILQNLQCDLLFEYCQFQPLQRDDFNGGWQPKRGGWQW